MHARRGTFLVPTDWAMMLNEWARAAALSRKQYDPQAKFRNEFLAANLHGWDERDSVDVQFRGRMEWRDFRLDRKRRRSGRRRVS